MAGDRCAFPRTLTRGTYGGDVNCLQQYLARTVRLRVSVQGFLVDEAPTGYFGTQTEEALKLWHAAHGISAQPGTFDVPGRTLYAKKHGLPAPGSGRVCEDSAGAGGAEVSKTCIDVCAEFAGQQDCQTRCVRAAADKPHACREACQVAFSTACDRAFPPSMEGGSQNYQVCLQYLDSSCADTCSAFR